MLPVGRVDDAVRSKFTGEVLTPAAVRVIVNGVLERLCPASVQSSADSLREQLAAVDEKISNLTTAIEEGAAVAPLLKSWRLRQEEREDLARKLEDASGLVPLVGDPTAIERRVLAFVEGWRELLDGDMSRSRQALRQMLEGPIRFQPDGKSYRFWGSDRTGQLVAGLVGVSPLLASPQGNAQLWTVERDGIIAA